MSVGDLVACGGLTASHSEVVSVPANLCVKLEPDTDLKQATYNTLGAIALQGVKQVDLRLGETCGIIGLGLLGQLTGFLLKASGFRVIDIDIDPEIGKINNVILYNIEQIEAKIRDNQKKRAREVVLAEKIILEETAKYYAK